MKKYSIENIVSNIVTTFYGDKWYLEVYSNHFIIYKISNIVHLKVI